MSANGLIGLIKKLFRKSSVGPFQTHNVCRCCKPVEQLCHFDWWTDWHTCNLVLTSKAKENISRNCCHGQYSNLLLNRDYCLSERERERERKSGKLVLSQRLTWKALGLSPTPSVCPYVRLNMRKPQTHTHIHTHFGYLRQTTPLIVKTCSAYCIASFFFGTVSSTCLLFVWQLKYWANAVSPQPVVT